MPKNKLTFDLHLFFLEILHLVLYWIAVRMPVDKNFWIFGAWFGETYSGNSKYLFEYVVKNECNIKAVWLTRSRKLTVELRRKGFNVYYFYSPIGIWYALRAGVAVFCVGYTSDLPSFCIYRSKKLIQLWHGIGPKKVGVLNKHPLPTTRELFPSFKHKNIEVIILNLWKLLFKARFTNVDVLPYKMEQYDLYTSILSLSPITKKKMIDVFNVQRDKSDKVVVTGFPRNDALFRKVSNPNRISRIIDNIHGKGEKVGFYLPTHRQEGRKTMLKEISNGLRLNKNKLVSKKIHLLVKLHHFHNTERTKVKIENVTFVTTDDIEGDIYPLLSMSDFLITDYSSVYIDYLLVDKPIIFFIYDIREYMCNEREFYFSFKDITPGPKVLSWSSLLSEVHNQLEKDGYKIARRDTRKLFHTYNDASSSRRVVDQIYTLLK